jgi:hypothetical protein
VRLFKYRWFPYVFALGLPLTVYSHNQAAFATGDVLRPTLAFLLTAAALVTIFRRVVANRTLADTLAVIPLLGIWLLGLGWQLYLTLSLLILGSFMVRHRQLPDTSVPVLNALAFGVLFLPVFMIIQVETITRDDSLQRISYSPFSAPSTTLMGDHRPDIYHIVLDAYGGSYALAEELGFDNSEFYREL